jgi:hypothetical protein
LAATSEILMAITACRLASGFIEGQQRMLCAAYDILKKEAATLVWVEASYDLESARSRVKELVAN